jgi:hydroxyacylglutathione hydrolase
MTHNIEVYPIEALVDNYIWAIKHTAHNKIIIVDPGESAPVENFLHKHNFDLHGILLTHHHADHTAGVNDLIKNTDMPVWGIDIDHPNNTPIRNNTLSINSLELEFKVFGIPGHTLDHIAFYGHGALFCGDTLFAGGMGRIFEGTALQMYNSVNKLASLPQATKIYCAHEYTLANLEFALHVEPSNKKLIARHIKTEKIRSSNSPTLPSTIAEELGTNPFLRPHVKEIQEAVSQYINRPVTDELEVFTNLRLWKDNF